MISHSFAPSLHLRVAYGSGFELICLSQTCDGIPSYNTERPVTPILIGCERVDAHLQGGGITLLNAECLRLVSGVLKIE